MKIRKRTRIAPLTPVRAYRLAAGVTLAEVALRSDINAFRLSVIERDPSQARDGELDAHRLAVDSLAHERRGAA
jgi:hypothetical protein